MMEKFTVIVNDIHAGSHYAVQSPHAKVSEFNKNQNLSEAQKVLYGHWTELAKKWHSPDILVLNGDIVEGTQAKQRRTSCWSLDVSDQADDAIELIRMFDAKKIFIIRGTSYHTETVGLDVEEYIGKELHAVREGGRYSTEVKLVNMSPKGAPERIIHFAHHMQATSRWQYRGTAPSAAMAMLMLNESHWVDNQHHKIFGIARGHVHHYWYQESASRMMLVNPCWQLQTPYMYKKMPESPPDIGATRIVVDNDGEYSKEHLVLKTPAFRPVIHS